MLKLDRRTLLGAGLGLAAAGVARAAQTDDLPTPAAGDPDAPAWPAPERIALWPGPPPGAPPVLPTLAPTMNGRRGARELWLRGVATPEIHVFRPPRPDGSALLAMPGGGYQFVSLQNEGLDVAQRFTASRTTVFVLVYRLPGEGWANRQLVPLQDAQRAMRLIRAGAGRLNIDPDRLGVVGFSAGGHLAADLAVAHDERIYEPVDAADRLSARPNFIGLVYPVVSLRTSDPGGRAIEALTGENPAAETIAARSPLLRISATTPPSFLVHAYDDPVVPPENSLAWAAACRAGGVPVDLHLFAQGGHGFGLHLAEALPGSQWPDLFALWMRRHGG